MGLNSFLLDVISLQFTEMNCFKATKHPLMSPTNTLIMKQSDTQGVERNPRCADWRRRYFKVNTDGQQRIEVCVMSVPKHPTRACVCALSTAICVLADFCGHTRNNEPPRLPSSRYTPMEFTYVQYIDLNIVCVSLDVTPVQYIFTHITAMLITGTHHTPHTTYNTPHTTHHTPHATHHIPHTIYNTRHTT